MPPSTGIVRLLSVDKSPIFNALTAAGLLAANYPFAAIESNTGIVPMPDSQLDEIAQYIKVKRIVSATIEVLDILCISLVTQGMYLMTKWKIRRARFSAEWLRYPRPDYFSSSRKRLVR